MNKQTTIGYLRPTRISDAEQLASWWADGAVMEHAGFPNGLQTDVEKLSISIDRATMKNRIWILEDKANNSIGEMSHQIKDNVASVGIKICDASAQGLGIGPEALKALIHYLFEQEKIDKIWLDTMLENKRAQHVYKKLHFNQTKINENHWKDQLGNLRTSVEFELLKSMYRKQKSFYEKSNVMVYGVRDRKDEI